MAMPRIVVLIAAFLAASAAVAPACAADAKAGAHATIVDGQTVRMEWTAAMPSVQGGPAGASFIGTAPSMAMGMMMIPVLRREDQTGAPVSAPTTFEIDKPRGDEAMVIRTGVTPSTRVASADMLVGGSLPGGVAASIGVAGGRSLAVVVQYN